MKVIQFAVVLMVLGGCTVGGGERGSNKTSTRHNGAVTKTGSDRSAAGNGASYPVSDIFSFTGEYRYPGDPVFVYDHLTGDISEWWDHSFSGDPYKLYIEPRPGGGFYEIFDASGDGVLHATVIGAQRGKMLRMDGPLGLAGMAIDLVITYELEPLGSDSTLLILKVNADGEIHQGIPGIVERVWNHFLDEQFTPYITEHYNAE